MNSIYFTDFYNKKRENLQKRNLWRIYIDWVDGQLIQLELIKINFNIMSINQTDFGKKKTKEKFKILFNEMLLYKL